MELADYQRYGRQMILDGFGLEGQLKLQKSSVVVIGAGGLGCPALQYLASAGFGKIGIVDHDIVELSNLQRQVLHNEDTLGIPKAESAAIALRRINSRLNLDIVTEALTPQNALDILKPYSIVLDCTDNAPTRYLLSDTCVVLNLPLVSGAAQKFEGQLCVYNATPTTPCYRCLFPIPPAPETMGSCSETGILGAVTGVIGNLQALEAIKLATGLYQSGEKPTMLIFNALSPTLFRTVKLRSRKEDCIACGVEGKRVGSIKDTDYVQFCGGPAPDWIERGMVSGISGTRATAAELNEAIQKGQAVTVVDVRPRTEFGICALPGSMNVPIKELVADPSSHLPANGDVYVVCRLGNDSQIGADALRSVAGNGSTIKDVVGGLRAWSQKVDGKFPVY
ncbi:hypothetical protein CYLTODRAFT_426032 [Cylindrobasidium torrendii FP15055 ss-10]|uniref:Rhodanese domain-containing protein n=1 Tax=Cylindrobasidium torrendii FP15055 ss-10 TaxID=1314674 RepID=A0A0D7AYV6_9AGAR|nr:hypothetical protein CYLTODRAFT_426032 [Cylindrobasidium torrendii FP15055 ss-10]